MITCGFCGRPTPESIKGPPKKWCGAICRGRGRNARNSTGRPSHRPPSESMAEKRRRILGAS